MLMHQLKYDLYFHSKTFDGLSVSSSIPEGSLKFCVDLIRNKDIVLDSFSETSLRNLSVNILNRFSDKIDLDTFRVLFSYSRDHSVLGRVILDSYNDELINEAIALGGSFYSCMNIPPDFYGELSDKQNIQLLKNHISNYWGDQNTTPLFIGMIWLCDRGHASEVINIIDDNINDALSPLYKDRLKNSMSIILIQMNTYNFYAEVEKRNHTLLREIIKTSAHANLMNGFTIFDRDTSGLTPSYWIEEDVFTGFIAESAIARSSLTESCIKKANETFISFRTGKSFLSALMENKKFSRLYQHTEKLVEGIEGDDFEWISKAVKLFVNDRSTFNTVKINTLLAEGKDVWTSDDHVKDMIDAAILGAYGHLPKGKIGRVTTRSWIKSSAAQIEEWYPNNMSALRKELSAMIERSPYLKEILESENTKEVKKIVNIDPDNAFFRKVRWKDKKMTRSMLSDDLGI